MSNACLNIPAADQTRELAASILLRLNCERLFGIRDLPRHAEPTDSLETIAAEVAVCTLCSLSQHRTYPVPGEGAPHAEVVFVGEGPGRDEDMQGRPFVGRAGKLLDRMIESIGLSRSSVFIANVVKCRPPQNRTPTPMEMVTCMPYLRRQLSMISPKVVCSLGATATCALFGRSISITSIRGQVQQLDGFLLLPTYHPAYLLRNPDSKKESWHDLKILRGLLSDAAAQR